SRPARGTPARLRSARWDGRDGSRPAGRSNPGRPGPRRCARARGADAVVARRGAADLAGARDRAVRAGRTCVGPQCRARRLRGDGLADLSSPEGGAPLEVAFRIDELAVALDVTVLAADDEQDQIL